MVVIVTTRTSSSSPSSFFPVSPHLESAGEGREVEVAMVTYLCETAVVGGVVDILNMGAQHLVVSTGYGILSRMTWEGCFMTNLSININEIPVSNDLDSRGENSHLSISPPPSLPPSLLPPLSPPLYLRCGCKLHLPNF